MGRKRIFKAKVDLSIPDREGILDMIAAHQQTKELEVPLRINEKLTVMVPPDKCNEAYRQWYISNRLK